MPALLTDAAQISTPNTLNIASNGIVSGNTLFDTPNLVLQGALSPGSGGAGAMTNSGSVTFGPGGQFVVTVDDATAGPVLGWSFLQAAGALAIQSTPANPFTLVVQTVDNPAANFNAANNYDWLLATAGVGLTGFAPANFIINTALFQNDLGAGGFYLHTSGNSLVLSFRNNLPPSPVVTSVMVNGNLFSFSGINGVTNGSYLVLATTNLLLPQSQWPRIATNFFGGNGGFSFTNPVKYPRNSSGFCCSDRQTRPGLRRPRT
jgi:hypothetical protein